MGLDLLVRNIYAMLGVWTLVYCSDYGLTLLSAKLHARRAAQHVVPERGMELTPAFQDDIARLRVVSPTFLKYLLISLAMILGIWIVPGPPDMTPLRSFAAGWFLLTELVVHRRHFANIITYASAAGGNAMRGRLETSYWSSLRISALEVAAFGLLWALLALGTDPAFFLGGAVGCLIQAWGQSRQARREGEPTWAEQEACREGSRAEV